MREVLEAAVRLAEAGEAVALVTLVATQGSTPRKAGARMLVRADGKVTGTVGGGKLEADLVARAREALVAGKPELVSFDLSGEEGGLVCGGTVQAFVEPIEPCPTLLLFGAGHVSAALARLARTVGFRVEVADDRPEQASRERYPEADRLVTDRFDRAAAQMSLGPNAYAVVATRDFEGDKHALLSVMGKGLRFVGLLGSRTKAAKIQDALRERGVEAGELARIRSPLGVSIGAQTPEEIAVSIVAELVAARRKGGGDEPPRPPTAPRSDLK